ncbi:uncharacterized protein J4E84_010422 [Alternaria hordeiaustralica]|uniref:uncharacterized protein n=1 Tax=Alternaria hordeiaustralica TaxID=1187925 RepID=UPI0020C2E361|nr:uncharacterized protein J4E84_010422 [Alternaria hordeiaustralica]KAI4674816.1 hypothetical protein J4E84_010422 [Alternaria hordeiaustralica]
MTRNIPDQKPKTHQLPILRILGKSEQLSAVSHALGFFKNVGMSAHYTLSSTTTTQPPNLQSVVYAALADVVKRHAILSAIPINEATPEAYFARLEVIDLEKCVVWKTRVGDATRGEEDLELDGILEGQHNVGFTSDYGDVPFWRLVILQDAGAELSFTASFIFHHSLGDGATGSIFHRSFLQGLNTAISLPSPVTQNNTCIPTDPTIQLLSPLETLHSLPINPNPHSHRANSASELAEWFGTPIHTPLKTHYKTLYFSPPTTAAFAERCKDSGVTVTSGLTAVLSGALFSALPDTVEALTGIIPINLRPWLSLPATEADVAMGSFIDAIKVHVRREECVGAGDDGTSMMSGLPAARHAAEEIKRYLANASPTGEPYTSIAPFKLIPDVAAVFTSLLGTTRDAAFEISNLGRFPPPADHTRSGDDDAAHWRIGRMVFSRSAVVFGAAVTTSVVTGADGGLSVGFCWQDSVVESSVVEQIMKGCREGVEGCGF